MSCLGSLCDDCNACLGMITSPCKDGDLKKKFEEFDALVKFGLTTQFGDNSPYAMVRYNAKVRTGRDGRMTAKVVVYGFTGVKDEHRFIDANKNMWSVLDNSIIYFDNGVIFNAVPIAKSKRIA